MRAQNTLHSCARQTAHGAASGGGVPGLRDVLPTIETPSADSRTPRAALQEAEVPTGRCTHSDSTGVQTQTSEDAGWRRCLPGPFGDVEGCSSRGKRFLGEGRTEHGRVEKKDAALHSSGALTSQARHSQKREDSHTDALIKFPSLL